MSLIEIAKPNPLDQKDIDADGIFSQWERDGRDILRLFGNDPSSRSSISSVSSILSDLPKIWEKILSFDPSCQWGMGERKIDVAEGIRKSHSCRGCRLLDFLTDLEENRPGTEFIIESGPEVGKKVYLQEMRIHRPSIKVETISKGSLHPLLHGGGHSGGQKEDDLVMIESDPLTSEYLNTLLLRQIFAKERLDPIQKIYTAFICQDRGFLLKEALIPLDQIPDSYLDPNTGYLRSNLVYGLFVQLAIILKRLRDLNVVFSKIPRLYLSTMPFVYRHQGKVLSYPLTLKLGDLGKTSLTYKISTPSMAGTPHVFRLFEKVNYSYPYFNALSSLPKEKGDRYRLNESDVDLVRHLHRLGFPVYPSSTNYLLLLSFLSEPKIGKPFLTHPDTKRVWDSLWPEDSNEVASKLEKKWVHNHSMHNPENPEHEECPKNPEHEECSGHPSDLYQILKGRTLSSQPILF